MIPLTLKQGKKMKRLTERNLMCIVAMHQHHISFHGWISVSDLYRFKCMPIDDGNPNSPHHGNDEETNLLSIESRSHQLFQVCHNTEGPWLKIFFPFPVSESTQPFLLPELVCGKPQVAIVALDGKV